MWSVFEDCLANRMLALAIPSQGGPDMRVWDALCSPSVQAQDLYCLYTDKLPGIQIASGFRVLVFTYGRWLGIAFP